LSVAGEYAAPLRCQRADVGWSDGVSFVSPVGCVADIAVGSRSGYVLSYRLFAVMLSIPSLKVRLVDGFRHNCVCGIFGL
jgi:hypothetical protein